MENYTFGRLAYENKGRKDKIGTLQYADEYIIKKAVIPTLSALKGAIMAIKEWAKANGDEDYLLMPYVIKKEIIDPNDTYRIEEINDRFYLSHLKKLEAEGKTITEDDKYISAFPSFDDVETDEEVKEINYPWWKTDHQDSKRGSKGHPLSLTMLYNRLF